MKRITLAIFIALTLLLGLSTPAQALTYAQVIIASSPERYYRLGESSGNALDQMWGISSALASTTYSAAGAIYDGDTAVEYSGATNNGTLTITGFGIKNYSYAVEAWIYPMASGVTAGATKSIMRAVGTGDTIAYYVKYTSGVGFRLTYDRTSSTTFTTVLTADAWHHTLLQWNAITGLLEVYLDGTLIGSMLETAYTANSPTITVNQTSGTLGIRFDEYALYHRLLTQGEINQHISAAAGAIVTATPSTTFTPSATFTPSTTPTATPTLTLTPGWDYEIPLPSGKVAAVQMTATAGDITIIMLLVFSVAIALLAMYLRRRDLGSK